MQRAKTQLPEKFYVDEPSDSSLFFTEGREGADFEAERALQGEPAWRVNNPGIRKGKKLKKILLCSTSLISQKDKSTKALYLPFYFYNLLIENGISEIYLLNKKTQQAVAFPLAKFKQLLICYLEFNKGEVYETGTAPILQSKLAKTENTNNWLIWDSYESENFNMSTSDFVENKLTIDQRTLDYGYVTDIVTLHESLLGYRLEKIKELSYKNITDDKGLLPSVFQRMISLEKVNLFKAPKNTVNLLNKQVKVLEINQIDDLDDLSVLSELYQLEELTLWNLPSLKQLPDLSQTNLKRIVIENTGIIMLPNLPAECVVNIELQKTEETEEKEEDSKNSQRNKDIKKSSESADYKHELEPKNKETRIPSKTYTDPKTTHICSMQLYFCENGQLTQGDINDLREIRYKIWNGVNLRNNEFYPSMANPESLQEPEDKISQCQHISAEDLQQLQDQQYYIAMSCKADEQGWMPLPARKAYDRILQIAVSQATIDRIVYNQETQSYWIKLKQPISKDASLQLIAETEYFKPRPLKCPAFPADAKAIINSFIARNIKESVRNDPFQTILSSLKLILSGEYKGPMDFFPEQLACYFREFKNENLAEAKDPVILSIFKQAKGSCLHRASLFVILCQLVGIYAQRVDNSMHSNVEVFTDDGQVITYDLSGHSAEIKLTHQEKYWRDFDYEGIFSPFIQFKQASNLDDLIKNILNTPKLFIPINDLSESRGIFEAIYQNRNGRPVFYAESYQQLMRGLTAVKVLAGKPHEKVPGPLAQALKAGGIVIINWNKFSENEMLECSCLLNTIPSFQKQEIGADLNIVNLIGSDKVSACQALTRRAQHLIWPSKIEKPKLNLSVETVSDEKDEKGQKSSELNLFNNARTWQKNVLGAPECDPAGLVFKDGAIPLSVAEKTDLTLVNAPLHDADFQYAATLWQVQKQFWSNGQFNFIPEDFHLNFQQRSPKVKIPDNLAVLPQETNLYQLTHELKSDIFYLNPNNLHKLTQSGYVFGGKYITTSGWIVEQNPGFQKIIVITEKLNADQEEELYSIIEQSEIKGIQLLKLTDSPAEQKTPMSFHPEFKSGAFIIETSDPDFVADSILTEDMTYQRIDEQNKCLFEHIDFDASTATSKQNLTLIAEKLIDGKTVLLKGPLSSYDYATIQSLMSYYARIKLHHAANSVLVPGRLIVVTPPLNYFTVVADHTLRHNRIPADLLWKNYQEKLSESKEVYAYTEKNFTKINKLADFIKSIPHGDVDTPAESHLTFAEIKSMLQALRREEVTPLRDNPLKSILLSRYTKGSEVYARINVVCKLLFSYKSTTGVRKKKLNQFPSSETHLWRRLNCLSATELRKLFGIKPEDFDPEKFTVLKTEEIHQKLENFLKQELDEIVKVKDHTVKVKERVVADLDRVQSAFLLGPPGSGKTTLAKEIAKEGSTNNKVTVIIDEANTAQNKPNLDKLWDEVSNPKLPNQNILFMGNPFSFSGRSHHPLWKKIPAHHLQQWPDEALKEKLLIPVGKEHKLEEKDYNKILKIFHLAVDLIGVERIGNRNLEQLIWRTSFYLKKFPSITLETALIEAVNREFLPLLSVEKHVEFQQAINSICFPEQESKEIKNNFIDEDMEIFKEKYKANISKDFIHTLSRWKILYQMHEQLELQQIYSQARSAILLEGPSGKGKSRMACELFAALGYRQFKTPQELLDCKEEKLDQYFIEINLTKELVADPAWLIKAFDRGCKVILNESNSQISFPLLNDLSTGITPNNKPATHPGFFLIATQNPAEDGGRFALSFDLMNRYQVINVPEDTDEDYNAIIDHTLPTNHPIASKEKIFKAFKKQRSMTPHLTTTATLFQIMPKLKEIKPSLDIKTDRDHKKEKFFLKITAMEKTMRKYIDQLKKGEFTASVTKSKIVTQAIKTKFEIYSHYEKKFEGEGDLKAIDSLKSKVDNITYQFLAEAQAERNTNDEKFPTESKTDVNATDSKGNTALHYAVMEENIKEVERLVAAGANIRAENANKATPISLANKEILKYFFHVALDHNDFTSANRILKRNVIDLSILNDKGRGILYRIFGEENVPLINLFKNIEKVDREKSLAEDGKITDEGIDQLLERIISEEPQLLRGRNIDFWKSKAIMHTSKEDSENYGYVH